MNLFYSRFSFLKFKLPDISVAVCAILLMTGNGAKAQQTLINYAQFADNLTVYNPAYSLLDKAGSVSTVLSRQFVEIQDGAPTAFLFNLNLPFESIDASGGLLIKNNSIGPETLTEVNAFFAKSVQLTGKDFLAVSLNAGIRKYVNQSLDPNDPEFRNDVRQTNPNLGFGVMLYSDNYYLGVSVPELTIRSLGDASAVTQVDLENHYYLTGAYLASLDEDFKFKPAALVAYAKGADVLASVSATLYIKDMLGIGAGYRTDKQASGILSYTFDSFRLGYSYQVGTSSSNFGAINSATHEVTLSYRFGKGVLNPKLL